MPDNKSIIIITINHPTDGVKKIASNYKDWSFIVVGDKKTPTNWNWEGVQFLSVPDQLALESAFARECPFNHYVRKNIGYLQAIQDGAKIIAETDDDNISYDSFLVSVDKQIEG